MDYSCLFAIRSLGGNLDSDKYRMVPSLLIIIVMRKTFICFILFFITNSVFAGSGKITIINGNKDVLTENAYAMLVIDNSKALWEGESYKQFCGNDYQERVDGSYKAFMNNFNATSNGLQITTSDNVKYKIFIDVHKYLRKLRSFYRGEVMVWCTIYITDIETGKECLKIEIERSGGDSDYAIHEGIFKCFSAIAKRINTIKK